jgi:hypothetical protein
MILIKLTNGLILYYSILLLRHLETGHVILRYRFGIIGIHGLRAGIQHPRDAIRVKRGAGSYHGAARPHADILALLVRLPGRPHARGEHRVGGIYIVRAIYIFLYAAGSGVDQMMGRFLPGRAAPPVDREQQRHPHHRHDQPVDRPGHIPRHPAAREDAEPLEDPPQTQEEKDHAEDVEDNFHRRLQNIYLTCIYHHTLSAGFCGTVVPGAD